VPMLRQNAGHCGKVAHSPTLDTAAAPVGRLPLRAVCRESPLLW